MNKRQNSIAMLVLTNHDVSVDFHPHSWRIAVGKRPALLRTSLMSLMPFAVIIFSMIFYRYEDLKDDSSETEYQKAES